MSNENRDGNRRDMESRMPFRKSYDTIPPQTGRFRNLFEEMQNRRDRTEARSQAQADSGRDSGHRGNTDE